MVQRGGEAAGPEFKVTSRSVPPPSTKPAVLLPGEDLATKIILESLGD